jgi:hypothetical protein
MRYQVVRLKGFGLGKPKIRDLGQHFAFARDAVGHDAIKGRDAIGGDEQKPVPQVKYFADFAAFEFAKPR